VSLRDQMRIDSQRGTNVCVAHLLLQHGQRYGRVR
jgi:hypothetical protein